MPNRGTAELKGIRKSVIPKARSSPRRKYRNKPTTVNGIKFASRHEAECYQRLLLLEKTGKILDLDLQCKFPLNVKGQLVCTYICDFKYKMTSGEIVVADAKGVRTPVYKIKKKLMRAVYGIEIEEI